MKKKLIRRALALACAASLCLLCAAPVFAATDFQQWSVTKVKLKIPGEGYDRATLTGPDVAQDGSVQLETERAVRFTLEASTHEGADFFGYGGISKPLYVIASCREGGQGIPYLTEYIVLENDGETVTFAQLQPESEIEIKMEFRDVKLSDHAFATREGDMLKIFTMPEGEIKWEIRCTIGSMTTLSAPQTEENGPFASRQEAEEYLAQIQQAMEKPAAKLEQPRQITFRGAYSTQNGGPAVSGSGVQLESGSAALRMNVEYTQQADTLQWEGETEIPIGNVQQNALRLEMATTLTAFDWDLIPFGGSAARAVATTAGAAALGLGGGAAANALSAGLDGMPAPKRREDFEDPDVPDDTPDLPEEDTPSVSVSFYRPFDDMVNTKGAAVDIRLTVNGGEGLRWNYLPTAICPGGLKAVIPAVVGTSNTATLVLNLTGAAMKKPHIPVFITVVAWAAGPNGLLKTTGTMELQLHRPGLEAERTADGGLKVTLYTDGNLDGVAEKVVLKPAQYTCTEEADGSLAIEAKPPYKGSCRIAGSEQEG